MVWYWELFLSKYMVDRHDGSPRTYTEYDVTDFDRPPDSHTTYGDVTIESAMEAARRMDLKDPDAGKYLPAGWEGIEPII